MEVVKREHLAQVWRLGTSTYKHGEISHAAECLVCGFMTFDHGNRCAALNEIGRHLVSRHPIDVLFAISDKDGVITGKNGEPLEFVVDGLAD